MFRSPRLPLFRKLRPIDQLYLGPDFRSHERHSFMLVPDDDEVAGVVVGGILHCAAGEKGSELNRWQ